MKKLIYLPLIILSIAFTKETTDNALEPKFRQFEGCISEYLKCNHVSELIENSGLFHVKFSYIGHSLNEYTEISLIEHIMPYKYTNLFCKNEYGKINVVNNYQNNFSIIYSSKSVNIKGNNYNIRLVNLVDNIFKDYLKRRNNIKNNPNSARRYFEEKKSNGKYPG